MQLLPSLLTAASLATIVAANSHTWCFCRWKGWSQIKPSDMATQRTLVYNACQGYPLSYGFFNDNKPIPSAGVELKDVNRYNGEIDFWVRDRLDPPELHLTRFRPAKPS
ncbi:hypothetical protein BDZ85DRAFT_257689 [Elsinoe ampelina]|uniref:Uncharacterized protein n=1 Tax=Elsinoe ampelina TaxID=302913 RepID=A0A6A6GIL7_9PEZI|nr:hypothetical protein BDZ85DRAFT_257689 [Elsinoe ampelina]